MRQWKEIAGYDNYDVSNDGKVCNTKTGRILWGVIDKQGYNLVTLSKNNKAKPYVVHRLVAQAFIENPEKKEIVKHRDGNNDNNHVSNLYWISFNEICILNGCVGEPIRSNRKMTIEEIQAEFARRRLSVPV